MEDSYSITLDDMIKELAWEISKRKDIYPKRVDAGKISQAEADRKIAVLRAVFRMIEREKASRIRNAW